MFFKIDKQPIHVPVCVINNAARKTAYSADSKNEFIKFISVEQPDGISCPSEQNVSEIWRRGAHSIDTLGGSFAL